MKRRREDEDWKDQAACLDQWEYFFGPGEGGALTEWQAAEAQKICRGCDVIAQCDAYAVQHNERAGVWGGVNRERKRYGKGPTVQRDGVPVPGEGEVTELRVALADEATSSRPDALGA